MNFWQWLVPWEPSALFSLISLIVAMTYIRGCAKISVPARQQILFWIGFISIYIVSHTELDYYAEHEFFVHRLQHSILHHIGPMLIVLATPFPVLDAGMPASFHYQIKILGSSWLVRLLMNPVLTTILFIGLICFWLIPYIHFLGMLDWRLYRAMNWGMLLNGLMFWGLALGPSYKSAPLSSGSRIAMMLTIIPAQIITGAVIFYAGHELYPLYTLCGRAFGGLSAMADQQIGGLILWIMGSMMSVIGILIIAYRDFAAATRRNTFVKSSLL